MRNRIFETAGRQVEAAESNLRGRIIRPLRDCLFQNELRFCEFRLTGLTPERIKASPRTVNRAGLS